MKTLFYSLIRSHASLKTTDSWVFYFMWTLGEMKFIEDTSHMERRSLSQSISFAQPAKT
nr:hypothetical protein [Pseudopedobacter sp.]